MNDGENKKWTDIIKSKKPALTEKQVEEKNKEAISKMEVVQGEFKAQRPQKPEGAAPTPPEKSPKKFEPIYDDLDTIMAQVKARMEAENSKPIGENPTEYSGMPAEAEVKRKEALSEYQNFAELEKSGRDLESRSSQDSQEYGKLPDLTPKTLKDVLYDTTKGNPRLAGYLENQIEKVTKEMGEVEIKYEKVKLDSFMPSVPIINEELKKPDKAEEFGKAIESAAKETDLTKQDKIIKDAIKKVVEGHEPEDLKKAKEIVKELGYSKVESLEYTSKKPASHETAKARPTGKNTGGHER